MKTIKHLLVFSVAALMTTSCDDFLTVDPASSISTENFYKTQAQMDQALTGVYGCLKPIGEYYLKLSEVRSDNMWVTTDTKQNDFVDIATFNTDALLTDGSVQNCWADYFKIVASANKLIDELGKKDIGSEKLTKQYTAEARFLRAFAYFDLVRYFGRVPASTHALTTSEAFALPQSEAKDTYEKVIVPDLRYAIDHLQATAYDYQNKAHSERATSTAAKALLARVYLTMAGYPLNMTEKKDSVRILCKDVIDYAQANNKYWASTADEWNKMWVHENDNKYFIFEIQYVAAKDQGNTYTPYACTRPSTSDWCNPQLIAGGAHIYVEPSLRDHFNQTDDDSKLLDKRSWGTMSSSGMASDDEVSTDNTNRFYVKFFENKIKRTALGYADMDAELVDRTYWPQNFPILRLEDVMLMYAEVVGNNVEGREMVNKIRERAGLEPLSTTLTEEEYQDAVADERRYELAGEGIRWHDLVRRNVYVKTMQDMFVRNDNTSDQSYAAFASRVTKDMNLYPIPQQQIQVRDGLYTQNPGYSGSK